MNEKELYQQKKQSQLDEWKAEIDKLKAKASGASAEVQHEVNEQIKVLEVEIEAAKAKLAEIADSSIDASEDTWESAKEGVESTWDSIKSAYNDLVAKLKK